MRTKQSTGLGRLFLGTVLALSLGSLEFRQAFAGEPPIRFKRHVLDSDLSALGADVGERNSSGTRDIIAAGRGVIVRYQAGARQTIDKYDTPTSFLHLRTGDLDLDGDYDVVAVDHRNGNLVAYENPGSAKQQERWRRVIIDDQIEGAHAVALGDIDRDGRIDILASGEREANPPEAVFWYQSPAEPMTQSWAKHRIGAAGGLAHYPTLGDVNGDGRLDVVHAAKQGNWFRLWLQPENPQAEWKLVEVASDYEWATNIAPGDINGDGKTDLVGTQGHSKGIWWFEGPNWTPHKIDDELRSPHTLAVADLDDDGDLDIATCAFESKVLAWFANDGKGQFERHVISDDQAAYDLVARDVDSDGDLDLVVAGQNSNNVVWFEQTGHPATFRVMTYNIHHGEGIDAVLDLSRIADLIQQQDIDVVALQEVDRGVERTQGRDLPAELAALTGMTAVFRNNQDHQGGEYGNAILTRYPVHNIANHHFEMTHSKEQRGILQTVLDAPGCDILLLSTHLDFAKDDTERLAHVDEINAIVSKYVNLPMILGGDFNDVPDSRMHRKLLEGWIDTWESVGTGSGNTIPVEKPRKRIDFIFAKPRESFVPTKAWTLQSNASDHLPVVVEFRWVGECASGSAE